MEKKDIGPRIALAYSPDARQGLLGKIFGDGKSSIRAGYSMVFDHFGAATVNTFDTTGSFGLSSQISNVPGSVAVGTAPRFTDLTSIPARSFLPLLREAFQPPPTRLCSPSAGAWTRKSRRPIRTCLTFQLHANCIMALPLRSLTWAAWPITCSLRKMWPCQST